MKQKQISKGMNLDERKWEDFSYGYIEGGEFDSDRTKTLNAMKTFCKRVPQADLDRLPVRVFVFAPSQGKDAAVHPWYAIGGLRRSLEGAFIYFSPQLEKKPQREVDSTVAHEFAHVMLGHFRIDRPGTPLENQIPESGLVQDCASEIAADNLIQGWGFKPAYNRNKKRICIVKRK